MFLGELSLLSPCFRFVQNANKNDLWLAAGSTVILPHLPLIGQDLLDTSSPTCPGQSSKKDGVTANSLKESSQQTQVDAMEALTAVFELGVDFCDVVSEQAEVHLEMVAALSCTVLFNTRRDNAAQTAENVLTVHALHRCASFALANILESFPSTRVKICRVLIPYRKPLLAYMFSAPQGSIQRSMIRVVAILHNEEPKCGTHLKETRRYIQENLRHVCSDAAQAHAAAKLFNAIDFSRDTANEDVEKFRMYVVSGRGYRPCFTTHDCTLYLTVCATEQRHSNISVDWDADSVACKLPRDLVRVPLHQVAETKWNAAQKLVLLRCERSEVSLLQVHLGANLSSQSPIVQSILAILHDATAKGGSLSQPFGGHLGDPRKISQSGVLVQDAFRPQHNESSAVAKRTFANRVTENQETVFSDMIGDGLLLARPGSTKRTSDSQRQASAEPDSVEYVPLKYKASTEETRNVSSTVAFKELSLATAKINHETMHDETRDDAVNVPGFAKSGDDGDSKRDTDADIGSCEVVAAPVATPGHLSSEHLPDTAYCVASGGKNNAHDTLLRGSFSEEPDSTNINYQVWTGGQATVPDTNEAESRPRVADLGQNHEFTSRLAHITDVENPIPNSSTLEAAAFLSRREDQRLEPRVRSPTRQKKHTTRSRDTVRFQKDADDISRKQAPYIAHEAIRKNSGLTDMTGGLFRRAPVTPTGGNPNSRLGLQYKEEIDDDNRVFTRNMLQIVQNAIKVWRQICELTIQSKWGC